ncbi:hypothetical protein BDY19DRAFT_903066 [Irpex rosettiformis]|uniref:Uncharacterized protein n=1 Tax=Irpex rosettiformis TaxID=378272 RepID=A0ACB8UG20_9APHY|nr:hypothetical protein BDY19DRAFT_903066 [Irpex rosettiformis]
MCVETHCRYSHVNAVGYARKESYLNHPSAVRRPPAGCATSGAYPLAHILPSIMMCQETNAVASKLLLPKPNEHAVATSAHANSLTHIFEFSDLPGSCQLTISYNFHFGVLQGPVVADSVTNIMLTLLSKQVVPQTPVGVLHCTEAIRRIFGTADVDMPSAT